MAKKTCITGEVCGVNCIVKVVESEKVPSLSYHMAPEKCKELEKNQSEIIVKKTENHIGTVLPLLLAKNESENEYEVLQPASSWATDKFYCHTKMLLALIVDPNTEPYKLAGFKEYAWYVFGLAGGVTPRQCVERLFVSEVFREFFCEYHGVDENELTGPVLSRLLGDVISPSTVDRIRKAKGMTNPPEHQQRWNLYAREHGAPRYKRLYQMLKAVDPRYAQMFRERCEDPETDLAVVHKKIVAFLSDQGGELRAAI